jgi:hypothetical protein
MERLKKLGLALAACALALAVMAQGAFASLTVDAKDFTEPVESQLGTAVPIVVAFLAAVFVVGYVIRWIIKRARSAT